VELKGVRANLEEQVRIKPKLTKPDKNYNEPGLMSMSPIRLIAYSPYTFSRFFNGAIGKHPDVRFSVGAIGKHPDEVYVKRKRKKLFPGLHQSIPPTSSHSASVRK
jgi:hypothetical protein